MDEARREFLDIVTQVRTHLEYQRALGVSVVELAQRESITRQPEAGNDSNRPVSPFVKEGERGVPRTPVVKTETLETVKAKQPVTRNPDGLGAVREELGNCTRCRLCKGRTTLVFGEGNPDAVLVFVGEGPGQEEDQQGRPFVGAAGQLLTDIIVKGMKLRREDVYICNIVKCRPPDNRNPEPDEIEACEPVLVKQLQAIKPKVIVALGNVAVKTLLKTKEGITALRGHWNTYQGIPLMPTFHPAYVLRNPKDKALVWEDIKKVIAELKKGQKSED